MPTVHGKGVSFPSNCWREPLKEFRRGVMRWVSFLGGVIWFSVEGHWGWSRHGNNKSKQEVDAAGKWEMMEGWAGLKGRLCRGETWPRSASVSSIARTVCGHAGLLLKKSCGNFNKVAPKKPLLILFHPHSLFFSFILWPLSQDPQSASKILWLDEIQHAVDEANKDINSAKQCKPSPPAAAAASCLLLAIPLKFCLNS